MSAAERQVRVGDVASQTKAWERRPEVYDPEPAIDLGNLGLVYELAGDGGPSPWS